MEEEAANAASGHYHHFGKDVRAGEMSDGENEAVFAKSGKMALPKAQSLLEYE